MGGSTGKNQARSTAAIISVRGSVIEIYNQTRTPFSSFYLQITSFFAHRFLLIATFLQNTR